MAAYEGTSFAANAAVSLREVFQAPPRLRLLILNNSSDLLELIGTHLDRRGCTVTTGHIGPIRHGDVDGARLIEAVDPDVVVFDVAPPYAANWKVATDLQADARVRAPFVFSTPNRPAFTQLIGRANIVELMGTPADLDDLYSAVLVASRRRIRAADRSDDHPTEERRSGKDRRRAERRAVNVTKH